MSTMGVILSTVGDVQYRGDIMIHVGDIMSTMEGVQYCGGKSLLLFEYPMVLNTPKVLMISPHMHHDIPHSTQISKELMISLHMHHDIPPQYSNFKGWYPPQY